jgi:hypothetical protein
MDDSSLENRTVLDGSNLLAAERPSVQKGAFAPRRPVIITCRRGKLPSRNELGRKTAMSHDP